MKKVGKYVAISFLLLLGLICVGVLYLFFIPNSSLFNVSYINNHKTVRSETYNMEDITQVNLNSRSYTVKIIETDKKVISTTVFSNSFGFVLKSNMNPEITSYVRNGVLTFNITEPHGFAIANNSYINLYLPETSCVNLNLKNKNAETYLESNKVSINNLSYKTENGDFHFDAGSVKGLLKLSLNKSIFSIDSNVKTNSNEVELSLTSGRFYAKDSTLGNINVKRNKRGIISIKECSDLIENSSSAGGQINIEKLDHVNIKAADTKISLGEVLHGASIDLTKSGSVKITSLNGSSTIITNSGNIKIKNCEAPVVLHTDNGDINVTNAKKIVRIKTNYGQVNVSFADDAEHYTTSNDSRVLYANIYNGKLTAKGVEHIGVADEENPETISGITVTGNGRINISMEDVCGENAIAGKNGSIQVVVNYETNETVNDYILTTYSKSGNVRVNLMQISSYYGYTSKKLTTTKVNCSNSSNTLSVTTTNGDLTLLDSIMYENGF